MSRIPTAATIEAAPKASQPTLQAIAKKAGGFPNFHSIISISPAAMKELGDYEIAASRAGHSSDLKADAAVRFAVSLVNARGGIAASEVEAVRAPGWPDAAVVEIVALVGFSTLTNYVNESLATIVDFPTATRLA
jgi:hypothetical protein